MIRNNFAERVAAWAAANPMIAIFGWLAFAAIAAALGAAVGTKTMPKGDFATRESARAEHILSEAGLQRPAREAVLIQSKRMMAPNQELYAAVRDVTSRLRGQADVQDVRSPLAAGNLGLFSWDIRAAVVPFRIRGDAEDAPGKVQPILDTVAAVQRAHPHLLVSQFGSASTAHALDETIRKDFRRAELTTVPLTMAILLVAFGALVAAGLPVLLAFSGVLATVGLAAVASHAFPASGEM
jgi:RND superfamily putative drug exporter